MTQETSLPSDTSLPAATPPVNDPQAIRVLLNVRTIAVVGLSDHPGRPSYDVARYMQGQGYRIIPVNPNIRESLRQPAYPSLRDVPEPVELVDIFRRSEYVADIVDQAIAIGAKGVWMQVGVIDQAAAEKARAAGLLVVMDRCLKVEHSRQFSL
jgi:predicted CoA-binding protein